jgi:hypothetical protein
VSPKFGYSRLRSIYWRIPETLVAHRAQKLLGGLPNALAFGFFEVEPDTEPLKVCTVSPSYHIRPDFRQNFDTDELIDKPDTPAQFFLSSTESPAQREAMLLVLQKSWDQLAGRPNTTDVEWTVALSAYLNGMVELRITHVHEWISSNLSRFKSSHANVELLRRVFESTIVDLRANVEICGTQCDNCQLKCLLSRRHDLTIPHDCRTSHTCLRPCEFGFEHPAEEKMCGLPYVSTMHSRSKSHAQYHSAGHAGQHM